MKEYENLTLRPNLIAETVCSQRYTGQELSDPSGQRIGAIEARRRKMAPEQVREFADLTDSRCRDAWEAQADWFVECVRARSNRGRDQLYVWITHWMVAYLNDPDHFRLQGRRKACGQQTTPSVTN